MDRVNVFVSVLPGRIRLRHPLLRHQGRHTALCDRLRPLVRLESDQAIGSLLLSYDPADASMESRIRAEVDAVLARHGFETAALASLSIAEQQDRLRRADVVIATYGSDLLANLFMPPGSHFIELNYDPAQLELMNANLPPLWYADGQAPFLIGTDDQGRDVLSAVFYGMRLSRRTARWRRRPPSPASSAGSWRGGRNRGTGPGARAGPRLPGPAREWGRPCL